MLLLTLIAIAGCGKDPVLTKADLLAKTWKYKSFTAAAGALTIDRVSGPVGEALVMTAAGLAVAIPAVLAYNIFGKLIGACETELEGFAHDLRELLCDRSAASTLDGRG